MIDNHANRLGHDGCEQVPTNEETTGAKTLTVGVKRGEFPDGAATVLVLDHFEHLRKSYGVRVPQECNLLFVRDTQTAQQAMRQNPAIGVVIAQGMSRKVNNLTVENLEAICLAEESSAALFTWLEARQRAGEPVHEWLDDYQHTLGFLKFLQQRGFGGLVQVVSRMLEGHQQYQLREMENLHVQYMDKRDFFQGTFVGKADKLWERIARLEQYEVNVGRKLSTTSPAGRWFDQLLEKAVYPHPAEDRLFDCWASYTGPRASFVDKPRAQACEESLTSLEELKSLIRTGDVRAIYHRASMQPELPQSCDCWDFSDPTSEYYWARYLHPLHHDFNLAVWEILDMAGLMEWMRLELELDLATSEARTRKPEFGYHVRRDYGGQLREFFRLEGPSEQWVGWRATVRS